VERTKLNFTCACIAFVLGVFLLCYGTVMGFACPGCGLRDPSVWLYTMLPWFGGAVALAIAGWLFHRARPAVSLFMAIMNSVVLGAVALFGLFIVSAIVAGFMR
jgi:hypothetical protein